MTNEQPEQWAVKEIETVTGDFLTETGAPFYRIEIDGYCADFDYRDSAENFAAAIQRAFAEREAELVGALEAALALASACMAMGCYSHEEIAKMARATRSTFIAALKSREVKHDHP